MLLAFRLADRLHKTVDEINQLSVDEIAGWLAYFKIDKKRTK